MSKPNNISKKIEQLGELVSWFEGEEFSLEQAVARFEEAQKLASAIEDDLKGLKNEITVLKQKFNES